MKKLVVLISLVVSTQAFAHLKYRHPGPSGGPGFAGPAPGSGGQMMGYSSGQLRWVPPSGPRRLSTTQQKFFAMDKETQDIIRKIPRDFRKKIIDNWGNNEFTPKGNPWTEADEKEFKAAWKEDEEDDLRFDQEQALKQTALTATRTHADTQAKGIDGRLAQIQKDLDAPVVQAALAKDAHTYLQTEVTSMKAQTQAALTYLAKECDTICGSASRAQFILDYVDAKAQALGEFTDGIARGLYKGFQTTAQVMKAIYDNPLVIGQITKAIVHEAAHPEKFWPKAVNAFWHYHNVLAHGTPSEKGEALGEFSSNLMQGMLAQPCMNSVLEAASHAIARDIAHGLGPRLAKEVIPKLEVPLRTDIEAVKRSIARDRKTPASMKDRIIQRIRDADLENKRMRDEGGKGSYLEKSSIVDYSNKKLEGFGRVHTQSNQVRRWLLDKSAIEGLTPHQIQLKFSLPELPTHISDVEVPAGSLLSMSRSALIDFAERQKGSHPVAEAFRTDIEGAVQYEILTRKLKPEWFKNMRELK